MWMHDATSDAPTNVVGNCLAAVVLARWDGSLTIPPAEAALDAHTATLPPMRALHVVRST